MQKGIPITRELSLGEVLSQTFRLYRRDFANYLVIFLAVGVVTAVLAAIAQSFVVLPVVPANATPQHALALFPALITAEFELIALAVLASWAILPIAYGGAIKMASDEIVKGEADFGASVKVGLSRLVWMWAIGAVVGIIVFLGSLALIVPGIILATMFSLVFPVIVIERSGFGSLGRSRELVSHRWLKTFVLALIIAIVVVVPSFVFQTVAAPFGAEKTLVSSILMAFVAPIAPIALTVYYYSSAARTAGALMSVPLPPPPPDVSGTKFCPSCGSRLELGAAFCPSCGTKQPA